MCGSHTQWLHLRARSENESSRLSSMRYRFTALLSRCRAQKKLGNCCIFSYWSLMYPRCILLNMLCFAQYFKWFESGQHWQQIFDILCMEDSNSSWQRIEMGACCFPTSHRCSQLYYFCSRELDHQMVVKNTSTCIALICSLLKQLLML